jgi:AraC family cel operon transcriptional repressor
LTFEQLTEFFQKKYSDCDYHTVTEGFRHSKHLTLPMLYDQLHKLSETELIYKQYHQIKDDAKTALAFVEQLPRRLLEEGFLQFPELGLTYDQNTFQEYSFFGSKYLSDLVLMKHPRYSPINPHMHNYFEALYVLKGEFEHTVSSHTFTMRAGDFCIVSPLVEHVLSVFSDDIIVINLMIRRSTFEDIFFHLLRWNNVLSFFFLNNIHSNSISDYILFHTDQDEQIKDMILDMFLEFENKQNYFSTILNSKLVTLFAKLLREHENHYELPSTTSQKNIRSFELLLYIQEHYKTVTLEEIAEQFHFSKEYTSRLIKSSTGRTFTQIHRNIRMNKATTLLANTNITINSIAEEIGYLNPEHFNRTFKKVYGMSPGDYRKKYR